MFKNKRKKAVLMIVVEILCLIILGLFLTVLQTNLSVNEQKKDTQGNLDEMETLVENAHTAAQQSIDSYDEIYASKAESAAFMFKNQVISGYTDTNMRECQKLLDVSNIMIINRAGEVLARAEESTADFSYERYNQAPPCLNRLKSFRRFRGGEGRQKLPVLWGRDHERCYGRH